MPTLRLLIKLDHYRIRGTVFKLMQSYLNNSLQYVCINNIVSNCKNVLMGVAYHRFCFRLSPISNLH